MKYCSLVILLLILFISTCSPPQPSWVIKVVEDPQFIQGLGRVSKEEENYREKAFKSAEQEIARQLNVEVKSISSRNKIVNVSKTTQDRYTQTIQSKINQSLKNVKKIDEFQDKKYFYLLLGLDKEQYLLEKKAEKDQAIEEIKILQNNIDHSKLGQSLNSLNKILDLIISKDLLYDKLDGDFLYTVNKSNFDEFKNQISFKTEKTTWEYNPLVTKKFSIPISILFRNQLIESIPIEVVENDNVIKELVSDNKKTTNITIDAKGAEESIFSIIISDKIFGENQNNFSEQLTLGNFVTQPIIGKLDIDVKGPLTKAQRSRLSSCLEQFFLENFKESNQSEVVTNISLFFERDDQPKYGDKYPFISYCSASIEVSNGIAENVFTIRRQKGSDFINHDKAFDKALNEVCKRDKLFVIFKN